MHWPCVHAASTGVLMRNWRSVPPVGSSWLCQNLYLVHYKWTADRLSSSSCWRHFCLARETTAFCDISLKNPLTYLFTYLLTLFGVFRWPECLEHQADILLHETDSCDVLHELLSLTSVPVRYEVVPELSTTLHLALNHANKTTRLAAVRHVSAKLTHGHLVCHLLCGIHRVIVNIIFVIICIL